MSSDHVPGLSSRPPRRRHRRGAHEDGDHGEADPHARDPDVDLVYDVAGPLPTADGQPPLLMAGAMTAEGFTPWPSTSRTGRSSSTTRAVGRSQRKDGRTERSPDLHSADLHALITEIGGPVDIFASSGGAVNSLAVAEHPEDVRILVAHEPPLIALLPDAEGAAAEKGYQDAYHERGFGAGMAQFIAMTSWEGEYTDAYAAQHRRSPQCSGCRPTTTAVGMTRCCRAPGTGSPATAPMSRRSRPRPGSSSASARSRSRPSPAAPRSRRPIGQDLVEFPSHHGGFLEGEFGYAGQPEAFAVRLREVLEANR